MPPMPGDRVGPYLLGDSLGIGGMATVYRATGPEGEVAVKILHPSRITTEELKRFQREFLTLQRLDHPNVIRVFATGREGSHPWMAMEVVDGSDLGSLLEQWQANPPPDRFEQIERIFRALCEGLAYIHEQGIVHRDLKPSNILICPDGVPRLMDFGVVKDTDHFTTNLTVVGRLVGTVAFMAPEQITGDPVDARADLYSLGAILYNLLTFKRPITADSIAGYLARHLSETPKLPSDHDPRVPRALERVCMKLLEKDPARRYASARQVLAGLTQAPASLLPLHGRQPEVDVILERTSSLVSLGVGGVIWIHGPPGSGRSRLLQEIVERAREVGASAVRAVGSQPDPLQQWFSEMPPGPTGGDAVHSLRVRMGAAPWVVVVDDLDRASTTFVEVVAGLVREVVAVEGGPLLCVVATAPLPQTPRARPTVLQGFLSGVDTGLATTELTISGLDREAIRAILRDCGLGGGVGAILGRRLQEELQGFPGLILEQIEALVQSGWLQRSPDGQLRACRPVEPFRTEPLPLPDRLRVAEARFLERLPAAHRQVLEALAVLRSPSSIALLQALSGLSALALKDALPELIRQGYIAVEEEEIEELYRIPAPRRAQVIFESIDPALRKRLHRQAAESLQLLYRRRLGAIAEIAAWHLLQADDAASAYPLLIQGAARALRQNSLPAARQLCQRALDAQPAAEGRLAPPDASRLRRQLFLIQGDALRSSDRVEMAGDAYAQALLAARTEGDRGAQGRALGGMGLVAMACGRTPEAQGSLEQAIGLLPQGESMWPEVASGLATLRFQSGDFASATKLFAQMRELGEAGVKIAAMEAAWGAMLLRRARSLPPEDPIPEPGDAVSADVWLRLVRQRAEIHLWAGESEPAMQLSERISEIGERFPLPLGPMAAGSIRVAALWAMGERGTAVRQARDGLALLRAGRCRVLGLWAPAIRVLATVNEAAEVGDALETPGWPMDPPYDGEALRLALFGISSRSAGDAWEAANLLLRRPDGPVAAAQARLELDAARLLLRARDREGARRALGRAMGRVQGGGYRMLMAEGEELMGGVG